MNATKGYAIGLCMLVVCCAVDAAGADFRIFAIPAGSNPADYPDSPTVVNAASARGGTMSFDVFIEGAPLDIRGYQYSLDCAATGGDSGSVAYLADSGTVDKERSDYLFANIDSLVSTDDRCDPDHRAVAVAMEIDGRGTAVEAKYVGSIDLQISADATGTFVFEFNEFEPTDDTHTVHATYVAHDTNDNLYFDTLSPLHLNVDCEVSADCNDGDPCTFDHCIDGLCTNEAANYGDVAATAQECGPDGLNTVFDFISVIEAIRGNPTADCDPTTFDISSPAGCAADGVVDLYDLLAVIEAFQGLDRCCASCESPVQCNNGRFCDGEETCEGTCRAGWGDHPCPGQNCDESMDSCFDSVAVISCATSDDVIQPGETARVEFYVKDISNVLALDLKFEANKVSEGEGDLACIDSCIPHVAGDNREDFLFAGGPTLYTNFLPELRFIAVSLTGAERDVGGDPAFLGYIDLTASAETDFNTVFDVGLRPDSLMLTGSRGPIPYSLESCQITVGIEDCNDNGVHDPCDLDCGDAGGSCDVPGCGGGSDCNENGIPDECDLADCDGGPQCSDCNDNGALDVCDILSGSSHDVNNDDIPDECLPPTDVTRMFLVRQGLNPIAFTNERPAFDVQPGDSLKLDLWLQSPGVTVRAYEATLDHAVGGEFGFIHFLSNDESPFINTARPDWIHFGEDAFTATSGDPVARLTSAMISGGVNVTAPTYLGEITYVASEDACGTFGIDFVEPGTIQGESRTVITDPGSTPIAFVAEGADVNVGVTRHGDVNGSGDVDVFDILCVLDGFVDVFDNCVFENLDIAPCGGDERIDIFDIFDVLDAFQNLPSPCPAAGCGPQGSAADSVRSGRAQNKVKTIDAPRGAFIDIVPSRSRAFSDGVIEAAVFARGFVDLRAYQVAIDALDSAGNTLGLSDVFVDESRMDYVFHGQDDRTSADRVGGRIVGALVSGAADADASSYLGTFRFRVTDDTLRPISFTLRAEDTALVNAEGAKIQMGRRATVRTGR